MNLGGGWMGGGAFEVDGECSSVISEANSVELHYSTTLDSFRYFYVNGYLDFEPVA